MIASPFLPRLLLLLGLLLVADLTGGFLAPSAHTTRHSPTPLPYPAPPPALSRPPLLAKPKLSELSEEQKAADREMNQQLLVGKGALFLAATALAAWVQLH